MDLCYVIRTNQGVLKATPFFPFSRASLAGRGSRINKQNNSFNLRILSHEAKGTQLLRYDSFFLFQTIIITT